MAIALVGPAGTYVGPQGGAVGPGGQDSPGLTETVAVAPAMASEINQARRSEPALQTDVRTSFGGQQEVLEPDRKRG